LVWGGLKEPPFFVYDKNMPVIPVGLFQIGVLALLLAIFLVIAFKAHWKDFENPYQFLMVLIGYLSIAIVLVILFFFNMMGPDPVI
tara:strand:+ start:168 stop:425 length:258 start_codon:yes stop_codon:yes gene_type:complete